MSFTDVVYCTQVERGGATIQKYKEKKNEKKKIASNILALSYLITLHFYMCMPYSYIMSILFDI